MYKATSNCTNKNLPSIETEEPLYTRSKPDCKLAVVHVSPSIPSQMLMVPADVRAGIVKVPVIDLNVPCNEQF